MGPTETVREVGGRFFRAIKREGLNPFDLISWEACLNVWRSLRYAGNNQEYTDKKIHKLTCDMVWIALERKAEALELEQESTEYTEVLEEARDW